MSHKTAIFYNQLADVYRYIFKDWHASVQRQGEQLDPLLEAHGFLPAHHTLYDCTCGIGTQVFGLAQQGWRVHGTDLSQRSIELARDYKAEFDVIFPPTFDVKDLLQPSSITTQYDVVISMDNAVPHFMTDADLLTALETMKAHLFDHGLLMIGIRDYDALIENPPASTMPTVNHDDNGKHIVFQTWDWAEDLSSYQLYLYVIHHTQDRIITQSFPAEYRALRRETLTQALSTVGFQNIQWFTTMETGMYQPIVTARKV